VREKKGNHNYGKTKKELTRTKHVTLRFSETQYDILSEYAKQTELTLSEYIRAQLMKGKVVAKYDIVADIPELKKLIAEFGKIRSNLNQIARQLNAQNPAGSPSAHYSGPNSPMTQEMTESVRQQADSTRGKAHGGTETHSR